MTETVEVTANATVLQTQDASVGGTVTSTELEHMPVNGRNYTRLILMLPGVSDRGGSQNQGTFSGTSLSRLTASASRTTITRSTAWTTISS